MAATLRGLVAFVFAHVYEPVADIATHHICLSRVVVDIHAPEGGDLMCSAAEDDPGLVSPGHTCSRYEEAAYVVGKDLDKWGYQSPKLHVTFNATPTDTDIAGSATAGIDRLTFTLLRPPGVSEKEARKRKSLTCSSAYEIY